MISKNHFIDLEKLKEQAAFRKNSSLDIVESKIQNLQCGFCLKKFTFEKKFIKHTCKEGMRDAELKTTIGLAAFTFFCEWRKLQKRTEPSKEAFMSSRQYLAFIEFAKWQKKVSIPNTTEYIKIMIQYDIMPQLWCNVVTYQCFIDWYDATYLPEAQFLSSIDLITNYCDEKNIGIQEYFTHAGFDIVCNLIRKRKLSPWLLLSSDRCLAWIDLLDNNQKLILSEAINILIYDEKFKDNFELVKILKQTCKEINL